MRVISGIYKGKKLEGFDIDGTRPTKDRVKESVFGSIQNKIRGSVVLDLFAGSGSIGIEALSNGASTCYFVENGNSILKILNNNLNSVENSIVINKDYLEALNCFKDNDIQFDVIYIDPPYHLGLMNKSIKYIIDNELLNSGGLIICEYEEEVPSCSYNLIKNKKFGKTSIAIYRK